MSKTEPVSILVVDDDPQLRTLMQAFLQRFGYTVETCGNATDALALVQSVPSRFSLVVADLSLPDMEGQDMAFAMRAVVPQLKILLCSGYPFEVAALPPSQRSSFATLQKPFLPNALTTAVEELLRR